MSAPEKIWVWGYAPGGVHGWIDADGEPPRAKEVGYTRSDLAQAMVAAALERAEELAGIHSDWSADEIEHYRRETQKDARAALDAMLAKAREDALREAAEAVNRNLGKPAHHAHGAILALIDRPAEGDT